MAEVNHCPECGNILPDYWPQGLCAQCALEGAMEVSKPETEATGPGENRTATSPQSQRMGHSELPSDNPVVAVESSARATGDRSRPVHFGDYELLEEVARGGMGIVYRARQISLNRIVALKMILAGQFASKQEVLRFRSEAEAAANLQHPNIVSIHETGECEGQHYFSMDFVQGRTLAEMLRDGPLPAQRAARYTQIIAEAIQFAHSRGILHRDLKSSNVLIDVQDQPRITDFGLAKQVRGDFGLTVSGQVLGSPNFMPPEQCGAAAVVRRRMEAREGKRPDCHPNESRPARRLNTAATKVAVGPWSDVYGIGAILYHLLTGRPPFHAETIEEVLLLLREADPVVPRLLNPSVPRDLETICLKCLQKEPDRRYQSGQELADELGRFLQREPIQARPISGWEKLWRWSCRKPLLASLIVLLNIVAAIGILGILWQWQRAERSAKAERRERSIAQSANRGLQRANLRLAETVGLLELERAEDLFHSGDAASGVAHLAAMLRSDPSNHLAASRLVSALVHHNWALPATPPIRHLDRVAMACFSPDGHRVLTASWDKTAQIWDARTGQPIAAMRHDGPVVSARYSFDGRLIVTASADGTARIWDASDGAPLTPPLHHNGKVHWAEFSPEGRSVTACADRSARIWDAASGAMKQEFAGHTSEVLVGRFSPDGARVATGTESGLVRVWSIDSGKALFEINSQSGRVQALAFSPNGQWLVVAYANGKARLWNATNGAAVGRSLVSKDQDSPVWHAAFSPDSKLILMASEDGAGRLWEAETGHPASPPLLHESGVIFGEFSPDGQMVVTTSSDNSARLWGVRTGQPICQPLRQFERILHASFSPDGFRLVTASYDRMVQIWNIQPRRYVPVETRHASAVRSAVFDPTGNRLLTASDDKTARLWDARTGEPWGEPIRLKAELRFAEFSPDGRRVVTAATDGAAHVWHTSTGQLIAGPLQHAAGLESARFSPDGTQVVTASANGTARVWDAQSGRPITPEFSHKAKLRVAQFSLDGRLVITASDDWSARVWNAATGQPVTEPLSHFDNVEWAEFSPDSERVVTASADNTASIWDVRTGQRIAPPLYHTRTVDRASFSPDGRRVVTASLDRTARIWDASTGQALTPPLKHDTPVSHVCFSLDGQRILTACWQRPIRLWDSKTGRPLTEGLDTGEPVLSACFDPTGRRVAIGAFQGIARVWDVPPVPTPAPAWFVELAEAVAGIRLSERGNVELVPREQIKKFADALALKDASEFYVRLARWFLADPALRPSSWAAPR